MVCKGKKEKKNCQKPHTQTVAKKMRNCLDCLVLGIEFLNGSLWIAPVEIPVHHLLPHIQFVVQTKPQSNRCVPLNTQNVVFLCDANSWVLKFYCGVSCHHSSTQMIRRSWHSTRIQGQIQPHNQSTKLFQHPFCLLPFQSFQSSVVIPKKGHMSIYLVCLLPVTD